MEVKFWSRSQRLGLGLSLGLKPFGLGPGLSLMTSGLVNVLGVWLYGLYCKYLKGITNIQKVLQKINKWLYTILYCEEWKCQNMTESKTFD